MVPTEKVFHLKTTIFPLLLRPLRDRMLPAPRDPLLAIAETYNRVYWKKSAGVCHMTPHAIPCDTLSSLYPIVTHTRLGDTCREDLVLAGEVLNTFERSSLGITEC